MKQLKRIVLLAATTSLLGFQSMAACPTPPTAINPSLSVKTSFDKKTALYTYSYTMANSSGAKVGISRFSIAVPSDTKFVSVPKKWDTDVFAAGNGAPAVLQFSTAFAPVAPSSSLGGFVISSKLPPGLVKFYAEGDPGAPVTAVTYNNDDEAAPSCPGFYYNDGSTLLEMPVGQTQGPVPSSQIQLQLFSKLLRAHRVAGEDDEGSNLPISSIENGELDVIAYPPTKDFDLSSINLTTIKLGSAQASPIKATVVMAPQLPLGWRRKPDPVQRKFLFMQFKVADLQIRCDADHSLFLTASAPDYQIVGSIDIQPMACTHDMWRQMGVLWKWPRRPSGD